MGPVLKYYNWSGHKARCKFDKFLARTKEARPDGSRR